jgi:hypothetical protein
MDGACSTRESDDMRNVYKIVIEKHVGKRPIE